MKSQGIETRAAFNEFQTSDLAKGRKVGRPGLIPTAEIEDEALRIISGMRSAGSVITGTIAAGIVHSVTKINARRFLSGFGGTVSYSKVFIFKYFFDLFF